MTANGLASLRPMDIVLIPGLWLDASSWDQVIPSLQLAGHHTYPLTLPGMESKNTNRTKTTLRDHVDAVVEVIDSLDPTDGQLALVGHSGGGAIAHAAVDARPDRVTRVVYVDSVPLGEGEVINDQFPAENGEMPLPDWSFFEEQDLIDLDDELRAKLRARAIPSPAHVAADPQQLFDERRYDVPITVISCEFPTSAIRQLLEQEHAYVRELAKVRDVEYVDLPTGHWPQITRPEELGQAIIASLRPRP
jgi:pimeloyl-ACP methyl ester carboxylesterase